MVKFSELIRKDREERKKEKFEGTFLDYLQVLKENPDLSMLSHQRMFEIINGEGVKVINTVENPRLRRIYGNDVIKEYGFFKDFYGIDKTIMKIVNYFNTAAMKGEESRQVLYLVGPVGAGKSSIMEALKKGLERSKSIYAIKNCPMREEPLHLVPNHLREQFDELLGVKIEGDLCPVCRYRLKEEYNGEFEKFPVETIDFSIRARKGVGVVPPVDPNNQDTSVLVILVNKLKLLFFLICTSNFMIKYT